MVVLDGVGNSEKPICGSVDLILKVSYNPFDCFRGGWTIVILGRPHKCSN